MNKEMSVTNKIEGNKNSRIETDTIRHTGRH